jgi:hypothetical protein
MHRYKLLQRSSVPTSFQKGQLLINDIIKSCSPSIVIDHLLLRSQSEYQKDLLLEALEFLKPLSKFELELLIIFGEKQVEHLQSRILSIIVNALELSSRLVNSKITLDETIINILSRYKNQSEVFGMMANL